MGKQHSQEPEYGSASWNEFSFHLYFDPVFQFCLSKGEQHLFAYLSYRTIQKKNLVIRVSVPFLANNLDCGERTIDRHMKKLRNLKLIRLVKKRAKGGYVYLVEPLLIGEVAWTKLPLQNLETSAFYQARQNGAAFLGVLAAQIDEARQNGAFITPKWRDIANWLRTKPRQNGAQIYLLYSSLTLLADAPRQRGPASAGKDLNPQKRDKGVRLSPDDIARKSRELLAQFKKQEVGGVTPAELEVPADFEGAVN